MMYIAYVTERESREQTFIKSEYSSKKSFASDLRHNGYTVHYVATEGTLDEVSEKYHANLRSTYKK